MGDFPELERERDSRREKKLRKDLHKLKSEVEN